MLIEQDYFRRTICKEHDRTDSLNEKLLLHTIQFAINHDRHIILEGILYTVNYRNFFTKLFKIHPDNNFVYYFDIPFDETLRRHKTKPNRDDFGETDMRKWFHPHDYLRVEGERIINGEATQDEIVKMILRETGL